MRCSRQILESPAHSQRQTAKRTKLGVIGGKFGVRRQGTVDQKMRDLLELAATGKIENVVSPISQGVSYRVDRAYGRIAGDDAREGDRLLKRRSGKVKIFTHLVSSCVQAAG
jgi:hypothetical protein